MPKTLFFLLLVPILSLTACNSSASDTTETTLVPLVTSDEASSVFNNELSPTQTTVPKTQTLVPEQDPLNPTTQALLSGQSMGGCTLASIFPEANPTEQSLFPAPDENDWSKGPETAAVTIVEYGDFQ